MTKGWSLLVGLWLGSTLVLAAVCSAGMTAADGRENTLAEEQIARGRYLAHHVAMCVECHSPRREDGSLDGRRLFQGAVVPVESPYAEQPWAFTAPHIAGLPGGWTENDLVQLLTTGKRPRGGAPMPPMPPFRMTREDAAAVAAYLKSL